MQSPETMGSNWVIGYGNFYRTDDGIGPFVAGRIEKAVKHRSDICIRAAHQLAPDLIEELQHAGIIIFVDATMDVMENGWEWGKVVPECRGFYHVTHLYSPALLLSLIQSIYGKSPETYQVSVQGDNFDFGEGLSTAAQERALKAASEIIDFLDICQGQARIADPLTKGG